jgi:hypothetical protein
MEEVPMKSLSRMILLLVLLVVVGGGVFLATWDIPAPSRAVEKRIPDARFPK